MPLHHEFERDDVFPSWFANAIQEYISGLAPQFVLRQSSATAVQITPADPPGIIVLNIEGAWRYVSESVNRSHPGGSADTYGVWAVASDNLITSDPDPHTDETDYAFELRIATAEPEGFDKVIRIGEVDWNGSAIVGLRQTYGTAPPSEGGAVTGDFKHSAQPASHGRWLLCDGSAKTQAAIEAELGLPAGGAARLVAMLGTGSSSQYGSAPTGQVRLPDARGRVLVGAGEGEGLTEREVGDAGGEETVQLSATESGLPSHSHSNGTLATASGGSHTHGVNLDTGNPSTGHKHGLPLESVLIGTGAPAGTKTLVVPSSSPPAGYSTSASGTDNVSAAHHHNVSGNTASGGSHSHDVTGSTSSAGGTGAASAHENMPPWLAAGATFIYV